MDDIRALQPASWIWCDHSREPNQYAQFLRDFSFDGQRATVYIAADMCYALFINGQYVPGFAYSDYPECRSIDRLDVTGSVRPGNNRICVIGYCQVTDGLTYRSGAPGIRFAVYADDEPVAISDERVLSRTAPDYESGNIEKLTAQLSYTFHYDATQDDGWLGDGYIPDGSWHPAVPALTDAALRPRPLSMLQLGEPAPATVQTWGTFTDPTEGERKTPGMRMQHSALTFRGRGSKIGAPTTLPDGTGFAVESPVGDGVYLLLDLGAETAGLLTLDLELENDALVLIGIGEHLEDLRVRTSVDERLFCAVYNAAAGRHPFTWYFKRLGGRYLQLHIYAKSVRVHYAGLRPVTYPLSYVSDYSCGDMLMDKIYRVSMRTLHLCMHEHYEDCPWREQGLYAMDSRVQMLCGYYAFHETAMPRESLRLLAHGQHRNGILEMCAPAHFDITIPSFSLAFIGAVKDHVEYTGDAAFAAEMVPVAAKILAAFLPQISENGLIHEFDGNHYWNFYEWTEGLDGWWVGDVTAEHFAPMQALYVMAAEQYLWLCDVAGATSFDPALPEVIARIRRAAGAFWCEETQTFHSSLEAPMPDSELVQALMVCSGIADERQKTILCDRMATKDNGLLPTTLGYSMFKYDALMLSPDRYAAFVRQDVADVWGHMLFSGATSFWETQRGAWDFAHAGSLCHGWSAVPIYIVHKYAQYMVK